MPGHLHVYAPTVEDESDEANRKRVFVRLLIEVKARNSGLTRADAAELADMLDLAGRDQLGVERCLDEHPDGLSGTVGA